MVKVNRKIGAVAVYSPFRAGVLVLLTGLLLLGGGFGIARLVDGDDGSGSVATAQTAPAPSVQSDRLEARMRAAEARVERVLARLGQVRAQRRALVARMKRLRAAGTTADAGTAKLATGRPYVVVLGKGSGGADYVIGARYAFKPGTSYSACSDGTGVCVNRSGR